MNSRSAKITSSGRIVLPAQFRKELGLEPGDEVVVRIVDGEMRIQPGREAIKEAQASAYRYNRFGAESVTGCMM